MTLEGADCVNTCGYHSYFYMHIHGKPTRIEYGVSANVASSASCSNGCTLYNYDPVDAATPNGNFAADGTVTAVVIRINLLKEW